MNEVSCRVVEFLFPLLDARRIPRERLTEGFPISLEQLTDPANRIDWDLHVQILEHVEKLCGLPLEDMAPRMFDAAPMRVIRALAFLLPSPESLYHAGVSWFGPSFFTNVRYGFRELDDGRLEIDISVPTRYRGSLQFFELNRGTLRAAPRLLGLHQEAKVEAEISPHRGHYTVRPPRSNSLFATLRRLFHRPFAAAAAVEELSAYQADLNRALTTPASQRGPERLRSEALETVESLGIELVRQLESEELPDRILDFLCRRFGWKGASLWMMSPREESLAFFGRVGKAEGEADWSRPLLVGNRSVGRLEVWGGERPINGALVEKLLPWIAIAVLNARGSASWTGDEPITPPFRWTSKGEEDLFLILDGGARVLYAGPSTDRLLGYNREELMQMDLAELVHPDDLPRLRHEFGEIAHHSSSALYYSARARHGDGTWRRLDGVAIKVLSEAGADVYLISGADSGDQSSHH